MTTCRIKSIEIDIHSMTKVKIQQISVGVNIRCFGNIAQSVIMSRTGINQVNKRCHLGLVKKTSLLHSLKTPLVYECNERKK